MIPPLRRSVQRSLSGRDVYGFKRELHRAGIHATGFTTATTVFGLGMEHAVKHFQTANGLTADGVIGPITHTHLWPYGDAYAHWLISHVRVSAPDPRAKLVAEFRYLVSVHDEIGYDEVRPIPLKRILDHAWPVYTDCSGLVTAAYYAAGYPDPNGLAYNGQGNTATLMSHLAQIPRSHIQQGDLAIFGVYPGKHVVAFLDTTSDPTVFSHGHTGSPDDPGEYTFSRFTSYFSSDPVQYYSAT